MCHPETSVTWPAMDAFAVSAGRRVRLERAEEEIRERKKQIIGTPQESSWGSPVATRAS